VNIVDREVGAMIHRDKIIALISIVVVTSVNIRGVQKQEKQVLLLLLYSLQLFSH
jgi:uncharacterized membrane protein YbaN (DUF454 family)